MNVTESLLRDYLDVFNTTFENTARQFLPSEFLEKLERYRYIEQTTIGYVSTQFGAGFEYIPNGQKRISTQKSYRRIEDLVTGAPKRVQRLPVAIRVQGENCSIKDLAFEDVFPFQLIAETASVKLISVRIKALGWQRVIYLAEVYGERRADFWSESKAVARAKDEVLLALLDLKKAEKQSVTLEDYLRRFKERTVLLLGDFDSEGKKRLEAIQQALEDLGYNPVLLDEIPEVPNYDLTQKAVAVASVVRFVVIDDSSKSGHLVEFSSVVSNRWVTIILRLEGSAGTFMTHVISAYSNVVTEQRYTPDSLVEVLRRSTQWAEAKIKEVGKALESEYPWRVETKTHDT